MKAETGSSNIYSEYPISVSLFMNLFEKFVNRHYQKFVSGNTSLPLLIEGKAVAFCLLPFGARLFFLPDDSGMKVYKDYSGPLDVTISADISAVTRFLMGGRVRESIDTAEFTIEGDADIAAGFLSLIKSSNRLNEASDASGSDSLTNDQGNLGIVMDWFRGSTDAFLTNLGEFWQEESRALPTRHEVDDHFRKISQLQSDYQELLRRVDNLAIYENLDLKSDGSL